MHVGADGYIDNTPEEAGNLCSIFKFKSTGYRNIDFLAFLLIILLVPLPSWALSQRVPKSWRTRVSNSSHANGNHSQQNNDVSNSLSVSGLAHIDYGTIQALDRPALGFGFDPDPSEITAAGPSNTETSGPTGHEHIHNNRTDDGRSNDSPNTVSHVGPDADRGGRFSAGHGERREAHDDPHHDPKDKEREEQNIVLVWIIGAAWSALSAKAARLRSD